MLDNAPFSQKVQSSTGLIIENRSFENATTSKILARDIFECLSAGSVAVVTDKPIVLLSAVRKQWLRLARQAQRARSSTLDHEKLARITRDLALLQSATFTADDPRNEPIASVHFATATQFLVAPPMCATLLIVSWVERHELYMLSSWMSRGSKVIVYD